MTDFSFEIGNPWFLLLLIPALLLGIIPFFRLHKKRRRASKHIIPFIIHMVLIFLLATTLSGMRIVETTTAPTDSSVIFVVDVSDSNRPMIDEMNEFIGEMIKESQNAEGKVSFGYVPFAGSVLEKDVDKIGSFKTNPSEGKYIHFDEKADTSSSNIAAALSYAGSMFDTNKRENRRVILLSDGRETDSTSCYSEAQSLIANNIILDAAYFDIVESTKSEIQIRNLTTNGKVEVDKNVIVKGSIRSTVNVTGVVKIYEDGEVVATKTVAIRGGKNVDTPFTVEYQPSSAGLHTVTAKLEIRGDTIEQNNMLCSWYTVEDRGSIYVVYGTSDQKRQIDQVVDNLDEYRVDILDVEAEGGYATFPNTMEGLLEYDEIVLMNVDFNKLPTGVDVLLKRYVEENGRGLVVTFGDECNNEFNHPELGDSSADQTVIVTNPIEEILPVDMKVENEKESVAFIFIVDLSSSMRNAMGEQTRYDVALASIKHALDALDVEKDYVGVIMFSEISQVAVDMQPLRDEENKQAIKDLIDYEFEHYYYEHYLDKYGNETDVRVNKDDKHSALEGNNYLKPESEGGWGYQLRNGGNGIRWGTYDYKTGDVLKSYGTKYLPPITKADEMFSTATNEKGHRLDVKQVVFISDGEPSDRSTDPNVASPYLGIVQTMSTSGIATSAIGIGTDFTSGSAASKEIRLIAEAGYTEPKYINKADEVTGELFEIVEQAQGKDKNVGREEGYFLREYDETKVIMGANHKYDVLKGYYGATIKEGATMVLYTDDHRPIIAEWQYGLGKVTAFMSDLGNNWTQAMFDNGDGINNRVIIHNLLVNSLNDQTDSTGIKISENPKRQWGEGKTTLKVETPVNLRGTEVLKAIVVDENGNQTEKIFERINSKKFYVEVDTPDETENGTYTIEVVLVDNKTMANTDIVYDRVVTAIVGDYKEEYDVFGTDGKITINDIVKNQSKEPLQEGSIGGLFENTRKDEMVQYFYNLDDEFAIASLILFVISIICRNFLFQKEKKRKVMTDEEQIASMRNSGR